MYTDPSGAIAVVDDAAIAVAYLIVVFAAAVIASEGLPPVDGNNALNWDYEDFTIGKGEIIEFPKKDNSKKLDKDVIPVPKDKKNEYKSYAIYYDAMLLGKGSGIVVFMEDHMSFEEAIIAIKKDLDVWTPLEKDAWILVMAVSGGYVGPEKNDEGNAWHYHLKNRRGTVHVFFGFENIEQVGRC